MTSPAFSFYAKDWLAATLSWPLEARGAYVTLLAYQWDAGFVPAGPPALARLLGVSEARARKLWDIIGDKFHTADGVAWRNLRLEGERRKQAERLAALRDNGGKGGRPKKPIGSDPDNQTESNRFPKHKPNGNLNESLSSSGISEDGNSPPNPPHEGGAKVRREHREQAKLVLKSRLGYCQHEPECPNQVACSERIALEIAEKAS